MSLDRRRFLVGTGALAAAGFAGLSPADAAEGAPVRIGYAIARSGPFAAAAQVTQEPTYLLWAEQVNAAGGLQLPGGRRRIQLIGVDDESREDVSTAAYLALMARDKVDLILAPWGTRMTLGVAPLANKFGYPLIAPTANTRKLVEMNLPYYFSALQQSNLLMEALADMFAAQHVKTVATVYSEDPFGTDLATSLQLAMKARKIDLIELRAYVPGQLDTASALRSIMRKRPEAFVGLTYPVETDAITVQAKELGFRPRFIYLAVGTAYPTYAEKFGAACEGILGIGSWNAKTSVGARSYFDAHVARFGRQPDRWASGHTYAALQVIQAAAAKVGLHRRAMRDEIAARAHDSILGSIEFRRGELSSIPGTVGQWQKGEFEVVWPPERATAKLVGN
ncbi:amino acid ABC transporter substrate-binding protein [Accumulibacter sp.]|uniref:amino acid ABC transporter substrate-binding protein n=1 Tax=Accumulibacter sp. TaxID=2053492 RepID=UPI0026198FBB|nr:amino acid ABC transporter substrate-binding protein [Accumulibacter sp.]